MRAITFDHFGEPREVLTIREVPEPAPGRGEVRVRMLLSPINPSDLLMIRGLYGLKPPMPATPGFEGVGIVEAAGPGFLGGLRIGKRVAVINGKSGNWQEKTIVPAKQVVPVPDDMEDEQAATFFVNPATAFVMTRWVLRVPRGAWLLQTAAGGALGRMVVRLGKLDGFRTINIVRSKHHIEELKQLGADEVICTADESIEERVRQLTGEGVRYALDCVGGAVGSAVVRSLAPHGRMLVYGTLALEPLTVDLRSLIVGNQSVEGFWLSVWAREQSIPRMLWLFRQIKRLMKQGVLKSEVAVKYLMDDYQTAVRHAEEPGKPGKVLLRFGNRSG